MKVREVPTLVTDPTKRDQESYIESIAGLDDALAERIVSRPTAGRRQIFNIVWNPTTEELEIDVSEVTQ